MVQYHLDLKYNETCKEGNQNWKRYSLGSFEIQLDPGKSGYWMVLIPLRPEDVDQPALALRNMALRGSDNEASQDPWGRK